MKNYGSCYSCRERNPFYYSLITEYMAPYCMYSHVPRGMAPLGIIAVACVSVRESAVMPSIS